MFKHGRESLVKDEGTHVSKEPLRDLNLAKKREWMERQSKAGKTTKYLYGISNNAYNVPRMTDINEK